MGCVGVMKDEIKKLYEKIFKESYYYEDNPEERLLEYYQRKGYRVDSIEELIKKLKSEDDFIFYNLFVK